jgi:hypothetical protein
LKEPGQPGQQEQLVETKLNDEDAREVEREWMRRAVQLNERRERAVQRPDWMKLDWASFEQQEELDEMRMSLQ